jgi:hypothetical protein
VNCRFRNGPSFSRWTIVFSVNCCFPGEVLFQDEISLHDGMLFAAAGVNVLPEDSSFRLNCNSLDSEGRSIGHTRYQNADVTGVGSIAEHFEACGIIRNGS